MEENEDEMIMDNIDEYVNDEMKVVSYKWLSLSLSLHVTKATQLLEQYVNKKKNELEIIYFVGGKKVNGVGSIFQYKLVKADSLDDVKKLFDVVTTCHIYSIQKSRIKDADVLYASDKDLVKDNLSQINKYSAIECDSVNDFSETEEKRLDHMPVMNGFSEENIRKVESVEVKKTSPSKNVQSRANNSKGKQKNEKGNKYSVIFWKIIC